MTGNNGNFTAEDAAQEPAPNVSPSAEKPRRKAFPAVGDIIVIMVLFFVTQTLTAVLLSLCGLHLPDISDLQVEDIESYMRAQILRGEGMAVLYPVSMTVSLLAIYLYIRFRGGRRSFAGFSAAGFNPNIILSGTVWVIAAQIVLEPLMAMLPSIENASDAASGLALPPWFSRRSLKRYSAAGSFSKPCAAAGAMPSRY